MSIGEIVLKIAESKGKSAADLARILETSNSTISAWRKGSNPSVVHIPVIAQYLDVTFEELLTGKAPADNEKKLPVLGLIRAGLPILAEENYSESITVGQFERGADFALRVTGDSMIYAGIRAGDIVLMQQADQATSGQIVAATVQDMDCMATLKYYVNGKTPVLRAANPKYSDQPITSNHRIIGVFCGLVRTEEPDMHEYQDLIARADDIDDQWREAMAELTSAGLGPEEVKSFVNMVRLAKK